MNYAFVAYENALRRLKEQVNKEYPDFASNLEPTGCAPVIDLR